ncbi:MAG TPA: carboxylating nicotinate-nucleotide diphosphorylase [Bacteroidia bacterium]|nr:carboxylating nicotinate-nucleotide diphosphorylase [Bacteroidia bacterium]HRS59768.1 carboxylating nicotinate-nucleotide diphosphorylase [Bacteroidia bacterium]HRU68732.1 carboxylating nicotinate-nucleotide diphosphorylase [Bacteroidia bacterium]
MNPPFISPEKFQHYLHQFIQLSLNEDIGDGDHTTLSTIHKDQCGTARLMVKDHGWICGIAIAEQVFHFYDKSLIFTPFKQDGEEVGHGEFAFSVSGHVASILTTERLVLNIMQRLSGITTKTRMLTRMIEPFGTRLLDTRKTTPGMRLLEKWAVFTGGGVNHRIGLYDMILIKDNHIDAAGSITNAVVKTQEYLKKKALNLEIEVEARTLDDVREILGLQGIRRVLLDNFDTETLARAVSLVDHRLETEASGSINETNIVEYAKTGVDYISSGSLTHTVRPLDLSLKIVKE